MHVVYYGLGGGHGHAVRGLAILGRWRERRPADRITLLAPERLSPWAVQEAIPCLCPPAGDVTRESLERWLAGCFARDPPDLLLVDVFPRGVLAELPGVMPAGVVAWLVSRWCRPRYYLEPSVRAFLEKRYRGIVWGEDPPPGLEGLTIEQQRVEPILISRPRQCLSRDEAREAFGVDGADVLVLILGSGDAERQKSLEGLLRGIRIRLQTASPGKIIYEILSTERGHSVFPAMRYLRAADLVVCAGGYHAFHETRCLGVAAVHVPQQRTYDDQFRRVAGAAMARSPEELERTMARLLASAARPRARYVDDGPSQVVGLLQAAAGDR